MEGDPRGFVKQWRKEIDSEVWLKPPLYTRFWLWLKMAVDYKTGSMTTTYSQMAEAIAWVERGVLKRPNRKTLYEILGWFEGNSMVTVQSNRQYTTITLISWHIYNSNTNTKVTQNGQPEVTEDGQEDGHSLRSNKKFKETNKHPFPHASDIDTHTENAPLPVERFDWSTISSEVKEVFRYFQTLSGRQAFTNGQMAKGEVAPVANEINILLKMMGIEGLKYGLKITYEDGVRTGQPAYTIRKALNEVHERNKPKEKSNAHA